MRDLVRRVQHEIIDSMRATLDRGKQRIKHAQDALQASVKDAQAEVASPRQDIDRLVGTARTHLANQRVAVSDVPPELQMRSSSGVPEKNVARVAPAEALATASKLIGGVRQQVEEVVLKNSKPKQGWRPDSGGCVLSIAMLASAIIFGGFLRINVLLFLFGALVVYVPVIWWLHHKPTAALEGAYRKIRSDGSRATVLLNDYVESVTGKGQAEVVAAKELFKSEVAALEKALTPKIAEIHQLIETYSGETRFAGSNWNAPEWTDWSPGSSPAFAARFAALVADTDDLRKEFPSLNLEFKIPALIPFSEGLSLLFKGSGVQKERAGQAAQGALGRLLATIPPGKLRFTFIDPISLGNNVAGFMPLSDHEESLITSRAWSEPQHIEQRLADLTEHMETVIQKYLRAEFKTIHDYNEAAKEVAEAYRFVVVFDFPVNFSDTAARRLVSIARNGPRCGVYAIIVSDTAKPLPYGFNLPELAQSCAVISGEGRETRSTPASGLRWIDSDFEKWELELDGSPPPPVLSRMIKTVGERAKEAMRVEVPYDKLLALAQLDENTWWKATTSKSIRVPLGPTGARKLQFLTLGEGMGHHALIVGRPGSGKSNLMHVIITTLALTYSPDEMRVYLIDFKKGVEFKSYADHKLPHAEAIAVESEREFGLSVVERLDVELKKRGDLFRTAGATDIAEYREKTGAQIPRILLLVDEFQEFFTQDDHVARQTTLILDRLVRQGRAFGIHIILGSQTLAGSYNLSRSTLDQMAVRIAMQCSETDSRLILSDDNPAARLLSRPGEAIYNAASGLVEGNNLFQVARFNDEDREEQLKLVGKIARDSGKPVPVPIVFEGNELAHLTDCRKLQELLAGNGWPTKKGIELWLGEPIAIRDPIAARIRRQSGSHLLILSRDEAEGVGMCVASILSVLAQQRPGAARVFIADFTLADSEWAERAEEIEEFFPHEVKVLSRQRDVAEAVKRIADEVKRRIEAPPEESSIFLVLQGMQRLKILRTDDDSFTYENESATPSELLATILREGPEAGVHVIGWCDTYPNAGRIVDRRMMREFGLRAGGVMSADDSQGFFDDSAASRIDKAHRVLFSDEERPGQLDKFRPYSMPAREWLEMTGRKLRDRTNPGT